ncbi:glycosyltransferase [Curtobacterium sp. VKM Ac-2884]|uniref:glycosyltransferase n=1 Tax=Curtobacterium sp. VKM Ac-2884 TaxID=2783818 RepID=UPI00188CB0C5|nr:glycosyltransferase [Curtobacterium sp. VKM Ac-2884]MBF4605079.1 glycosyltransferase [Curtobacterium sp. VKM Ac-2884]
MIVFVQPHLRFGGAERQTVSVANALSERGHDVAVVLHSGGGGLESTLRPEVELHVLGVDHHLATPEIARRLYAVLRRMPPSFVVVKLWSSILACALIDRLPGARDHTYNYCEDLDPRDHATYIALGRAKQRLIGRVFRSRAHLTANTETVASSMVDVYGLRRTPAVIPSTIDTDEVRRLAAGSPQQRDDRFTVVSVGSLIERKGLDRTWAALQQLDRPVHWRVVGEGPLRTELEALRRRSGLVQVSIEGGHANPYGYMAAADVLVHGARSEAWGIVLLEAMAVGTPVVATGSIGPLEMQRALGEQPDLMQTVPLDDVDGLREAIERSAATARPALRSFDSYIAPFSVTRATRMWEDRAARLLGTSR